jgi:DUF971 family protein
VDGYALSWSELADGDGVGERAPDEADPVAVVRVGEAPRIRGLWRESARALGVWWTTGRRATYDAVRLRSVCPCASCVDERTGRRVLRPEDISPGLTLEAVRAVGAYAMSIRFSDGHETGIYPYDRLAGWEGA